MLTTIVLMGNSALSALVDSLVLLLCDEMKLK